MTEPRNPKRLTGVSFVVAPLSGRPLYPHRLSRCFVSNRSPSVSPPQICPRRFPKAAQTGRSHSPVKVGKRSGTAAVGYGSCVPLSVPRLLVQARCRLSGNPVGQSVFPPVLVPFPCPVRPCACMVGVWRAVLPPHRRRHYLFHSKLNLIKRYLTQTAVSHNACMHAPPTPKLQIKNFNSCNAFSNHFKIAPKIDDFSPPR